MVAPTWPANPVVLEINTWVWLEELSRLEGRRVTLADVPPEAWDRVAPPGVDAVWLMGVWERSPFGAKLARSNEALSAAHRGALADVTDADVVGSAYCVRSYAVDSRLGGNAGLAIARADLVTRGVRLVLDIVANHVAPDHPWVIEHPEWFVQATEDDLVREPGAYIEVEGHVIACGRDPYFPPWPDVVQLDTTHPGLRRAMAAVAVDLASICDGLRCDMAMLVLDDVVAGIWGRHPAEHDPGFWPTVIGAVRAARPGFVFWGEAYWGREGDLVRQGFDACYDKGWYDRMVGRAPAWELAGGLHEDEWPRPGQRVRFVENHDEQRVAAILSPAHHRAALVALLTLPGVALLHEGEADGRRVRVPVTLRRRPAEAPDLELRAFVDRLLADVAILRRGEWALAHADGLLAWTWSAPSSRRVVCVNLSHERVECKVGLPWDDLRAVEVALDPLAYRLLRV